MLLQHSPYWWTFSAVYVESFRTRALHLDIAVQFDGRPYVKLGLINVEEDAGPSLGSDGQVESPLRSLQKYAASFTKLSCSQSVWPSEGGHLPHIPMRARPSWTISEGSQREVLRLSLLARRRTQKSSPRKYGGRRSWEPFYPSLRQRRVVGSEHRWRGEAQAAISVIQWPPRASTSPLRDIQEYATTKATTYVKYHSADPAAYAALQVIRNTTRKLEQSPPYGWLFSLVSMYSASGHDMALMWTKTAYHSDAKLNIAFGFVSPLGSEVGQHSCC